MFDWFDSVRPLDEACPERQEFRDDEWLDRIGNHFISRVLRRRLAQQNKLDLLLAKVNSHELTMQSCTDAELLDQCRLLSQRLRKTGLTVDLVAEAFALIRENADRHVGLRHFPVQLMGGWIMLNGMIAEMDTGEGKTLTATLAAGTAALAGIPVHVVTVNDYLAGRDHAEMQPLYRAMGVSTAVVNDQMSFSERQKAYQADVVYCTNKTLVFDYLRDRIVLGRNANNLRVHLESLHGQQARRRKLLLRGLHFAIVDEADSVLIDEARTPLIISGNVPEVMNPAFCQEALSLAEKLKLDRDFVIVHHERQIRFTEIGVQRIQDLGASLGPAWKDVELRKETFVQALSALHLFIRDEHYLLRDGKIQVIDEHTGRTMADRSWSHGLQQMIEAKEGCELTRQRETLARISYQRFFMRYLRLSGMTGTASEVARELGAVYGLAVVKVPTNRPSRRKLLRTYTFATADEKWQAITARVQALHRSGNPVLLGTRTVAASEEAARRLSVCHLPYRLLSAKQDKEEAEIIAEAGLPGRITIATNMAGRGTDIRLAEESLACGGLHVILSERHEARRIDRQLAGRCGRQGDPGCCETFLSLDDVILEPFHQMWSGIFIHSIMRLLPFSVFLLGSIWIDYAQRRSELVQLRTRRALLKSDRQTGDILAFSGKLE